MNLQAPLLLLPPVAAWTRTTGSPSGAAHRGTGRGRRTLHEEHVRSPDERSKRLACLRWTEPSFWDPGRAFELAGIPFGGARRLVAVEDDPVMPGTHLRHDFLQARLESAGGVEDQLAHLLGETVAGADAPVDIAVRVYDVPGV